MTNNTSNKELSQEKLQEMMKHYTGKAQKAMQLLQSENPEDKEKALKELNNIKAELMDVIYSLADKIGLPKDYLKQMIKDPASFLSEEAKKNLEKLQTTANK